MFTCLRFNILKHAPCSLCHEGPKFLGQQSVKRGILEGYGITSHKCWKVSNEVEAGYYDGVGMFEIPPNGLQYVMLHFHGL